MAALAARVDVAALPKAVRQRIADVGPRSRGTRGAAERAAFRQRMAEINANLAIEDLALTTDELAFFGFVFELNLPEDEETKLHELWAHETARAVEARMNAAE